MRTKHPVCRICGLRVVAGPPSPAKPKQCQCVRPYYPPIEGFKTKEDAIVACPACAAPIGVACAGTIPGLVHFGRRLKRLLLTAAATPEERKAFERAALAATERRAT